MRPLGNCISFTNTEEKIRFVILEKKKNLLFMIPAAWAQALFKNSWNIFIIISILDQNSHGISPYSRSMESPACQETMVLGNVSCVFAKGSSLLYNLKCCSSIWNKLLSVADRKENFFPMISLLPGTAMDVCSKQASWMQFRFPSLQLFFYSGF